MSAALDRSGIQGSLAAAWLVTLLVSDLPNILWQVLGGSPPGWLWWARVGLLAGLVLASLIWGAFRALRAYFLLLLALLLGLQGMAWLRAAPAYLGWEKQAGWVLAMAAYEGCKLAVSGGLVLVLLGLGFRRADFFLAKGDRQASFGAVRWLGIKPGESWAKMSLVFILIITPATVLLFWLTGGQPAGAALLRALPLLPAALVFAALNAFNEEVQFRAALLAPLEPVFPAGPADAGPSLWLTAAFFGLAHYFGGSPSGPVGVLITGFLGWLFAKAMLETRGIATGWLIHFVQNVVIYTFWAVAAAG